MGENKIEKIKELLWMLGKIEEKTNLDDFSEILKCDRNTSLVKLYQLKSLGWIDSSNIEDWKLTVAGSQAKKLISSFSFENKNEKGLEKDSILITFPREFGDISKSFPNFIEIAKCFKNELKGCLKGGEVLILTYAIDFRVLSNVLEDIDIIPPGFENKFPLRIIYFKGYEQQEIDKLIRNGFNIQVSQIKMLGTGNQHAKVIIFKKPLKSNMIISSANFTYNVFSPRNLEVGFLVRDINKIKEMENLFEWLWKKIKLD